ncbi:hypothetical protein GGR56DRAFT_625136 [Xylariaceae sp. FL0804]|nr:hypothetical protein GGR56DRAFT_625136 [Xylariaceae sp. FL0804]
MSPPRRRSARLASSPSKRSVASPAPRLASVSEHNEPAQDQQTTRSIDVVMSSPMSVPRTPAAATPVKLPMSEMHPSKAHRTMGPPSSGQKLGFTDIDYTNDGPSASKATPSKTPAPEFTFRYPLSSGDSGMGPAATKMMEELRNKAAFREETARIKAELAAQRAQERSEQGDGRKIAKAKGKAGRYSAVHMAEFKKMDSIEGHPSAFRAGPARATPAKTGIKRSQSKANLDEPESAQSKTAPSRPVPKTLEQKTEQPDSPSKRSRQRFDDDASAIRQRFEALRPVSRDGTFIPRPKSSGNDSVRSGIPRSQTHGTLMSPTKASLAHATSPQKATVSLVKSPSKPELGGLARSPSKPDLASLARSPSKNGFGSLKKSATTANLNPGSDVPTHVQTPGRFTRVKSILKRQFSASKPKSNIPHLTASPTKSYALQEITESVVSSVPHTAPSRKYEHVDFTPRTKKVIMANDSPSPVKFGLSHSKSVSKLPAPNFGSSARSKTSADAEGQVAYPDLSAYDEDAESGDDKPEPLPQSVPGTFSFRSDHTIRFDSTSPNGFGARAGQASLRQVTRDSAIPVAARMPGAFPRAPSTSPSKDSSNSNKENSAPPLAESGIPHGMPNKKRSRASWDEEEEEEDESAVRAQKKLRKNPPSSITAAAAAEGHAVVAPRMAAADQMSLSPAKKAAAGLSVSAGRGLSAGSPSPQKKRAGGMSLSRLQMLARPKVRK